MSEDEIKNKYSQDVKDGFGLGHGPIIQDIVNRLDSGSINAPISIEEGLKSLNLVHAIYRSAETRSWVNFNDDLQSELLGVNNK